MANRGFTSTLLIGLVIVLLTTAGYWYWQTQNQESGTEPTPTIKTSTATSMQTPIVTSQTPTPTAVVSTSTPFLSPTVTEELSTATPTMTPSQEKFAHEYLPGFEISYANDEWSLQTKPFDSPEANAIYKSDCDENCMELVLTKGNVSLEIAFVISFEDLGYLRCSNEADMAKVNNEWYRIKNKDGYFYSRIVDTENPLGAKENYTATEDDCLQSEWSLINIPEKYGEGWECTADKQYKICDSGHGVFLSSHSMIQQGQDGDGVPIIMEKPKIIGNPDESLLEEIDEIVSSVKFE